METQPPPAAADAANPLKFTVATVTYNAGSLIGRTIESVERQTYTCIEHVIVDGKSADDTLALVHRYQERNSRREQPRDIVCRTEPDEGIYDAMNKALTLATGHYILFLNAGDTLHDDRVLEEIARQIGTQRPAVVYGRTDIVDDAGRFVRHRRLEPPARLDWRSLRSGMLVCHQSFLARTDLAQATPYDLGYRFSADFDWCLRLLRKAESEPLAPHNTHIVIADFLEGGATARHHRASLRERFRIMARHYGWATTAACHAWFAVRAVLKR
ncbi:MAG: glycosyltransferase [Prevotellaceae bacterium]|nr:glycosyltransferase [Prevotellaceae bacterium]